MIKPAGFDELSKRANAAPSSKAVKEAADITDILRRYTGRELKHNRGNCPFCSGERNDTFVIYPDTQRYQCHRCGAKGDVFALVQALCGVGFKDAVQLIAKDYGLDDCSQDAHAALRAAVAYREQQEAQRREALQDFHRWRDLWITLDRWRTTYPPGDPRHDDAERDIALASYRWDCAEARLNQVNSSG